MATTPLVSSSPPTVYGTQPQEKPHKKCPLPESLKYSCCCQKLAGTFSLALLSGISSAFLYLIGGLLYGAGKEEAHPVQVLIAGGATTFICAGATIAHLIFKKQEKDTIEKV